MGQELLIRAIGQFAETTYAVGSKRAEVARILDHAAKRITYVAITDLENEMRKIPDLEQAVHTAAATLEYKGQFRITQDTKVIELLPRIIDKVLSSNPPEPIQKALLAIETKLKNSERLSSLAHAIINVAQTHKLIEAAAKAETKAEIPDLEAELKLVKQLPEILYTSIGFSLSDMKGTLLAIKTNFGFIVEKELMIAGRTA